jgi:hypothetical protein
MRKFILLVACVAALGAIAALRSVDASPQVAAETLWPQQMTIESPALPAEAYDTI